VLGVIATRFGELAANILEVDHRRLFLDVPAKGAKLDVTVETRNAAHAEEIHARSRPTATCRSASRPAARWSEARVVNSDSEWRIANSESECEAEDLPANNSLSHRYSPLTCATNRSSVAERRSTRSAAPGRRAGTRQRCRLDPPRRRDGRLGSRQRRPAGDRRDRPCRLLDRRLAYRPHRLLRAQPVPRGGRRGGSA
jgi:hypothetical protein